MSSPKQDTTSTTLKPFLTAATAVPGVTRTIYPKSFQGAVQGRMKRKLGDCFGLVNFGVNYTTLAPGSASALKHHHQLQDEFVYILQGTATLLLGEDEYEMKPGDCVGFPAGDGVGHCISNRTNEPVVLLEIGDRTPGDVVDYPGLDLKVSDVDGQWKITHKDGSPYEE